MEPNRQFQKDICRASSSSSYNEQVISNTPPSVRIVLGLEWILSVVAILVGVINLTVKLIRKGILAGQQAVLNSADYDISLEEILVWVTIAIAVAAISIMLIVVLGLGITQRNATKCKIWFVSSIFIWIFLITLFGYGLLNGYLLNLAYIGFIIIIAYKLFAIITIKHFINLLTNEQLDHVKLFPSINL